MIHKNKTLATLLAIVLGGLGIHRFYLHGRKDIWGWLHFAALPLSLLAWLAAPDQPLLFTGILFVISVLVGQLEALVIGLTPDERWDAACNPGSGKQSRSGWPLVLLLIVAMALGTTGLIAAIARTFDLLFTGGAYG
jgi:TM2 domain-containing membrane protein YozV